MCPTYHLVVVGPYAAVRVLAPKVLFDLSKVVDSFGTGSLHPHMQYGYKLLKAYVRTCKMNTLCEWV